MILHRLHIDRFKNLRDFEIDFDSGSLIDIIIGKNGSGKSNLFEAIIDIFRFLADADAAPAFNFTIEYTCGGATYAVASKDGKLSLNEKSVKRVPDKALPENVLIYYSGHNDRVASLIKGYEDSYRSRIKGDELTEIRRFFGLTTDHKAILLLLLLMMEEGVPARDQTTTRLCAAQIDSDIRITLKRPHFRQEPLSSWDAMPFWGTKGYLSDFLQHLDKLSTKGKGIRDEGYFAESEQFVFYLDPSKLRELIAESSPITVFQYLDDLRVIDMLADVDFEIALQNGEKIRLSHFSDGEYQAVFFNGMLELFKDRDCVLLLDEPDAFLHPEWQFDLVRQIVEHADRMPGQNHILMTSHCASTLVSSGDNRISLLEVDGNSVRCHSVSKEYAITNLSAGLIALNEEKQMLCILSSIKAAGKPVLFTEGPTDAKIIETAWGKLRETAAPFMVVHAFGRGYLRQLLKNPEIYAEADGVPVFGLFDFDEAYDDWVQIKGAPEEQDPFKGLCTKIADRNGFAYLLPVPANGRLHAQVIKDPGAKTTFEGGSKISIEHLFFGADGTDKYFPEEPVTGGGTVIGFTGGKTHFAHEVVPLLPKAAFAEFEPLFASIEQKI